MKWRNQLLALACLLVFLAFGVFYFRYWVVQKPFGIILFVAEGLEPSRLTAARALAGEPDSPLNIDSFPYSALLQNSARDSAIPDEAAAATALATGVKVKRGSIAIDVAGKKLTSLLELARKSGRMTGLVTNGLLTDPTAASFYGHSIAAENRDSLARELVEKADLDVVLGGGGVDFLPATKEGRRTDGVDLRLDLRSRGYEVVQNLEELEAVPRWRAAKLFGIFAPRELAFTEQRPDNQPRLADLVRQGIELLQFNSGGYVLVVDAGLMRRAAEAGKDEQAALELLELDRAVGVALEYAGAKSAIFVCSDVVLEQLNHRETSTEGAKAREARTPGSQVDPGETASDDTSDRARTASAETTGSPAAAGKASASDVIAFGHGMGAEALHGTLENTALFEIIRDNL